MSNRLTSGVVFLLALFILASLYCASAVEPLSIDKLAAKETLHLNDIVEAVDAGLPDNAATAKGETLLMLAVTKNVLPGVEYLIGKRVDLEAVDNEGETALIKALNYRFPIARLLIEKGAAANQPRAVQWLLDQKRAIDVPTPKVTPLCSTPFGTVIQKRSISCSGMGRI